MRRPFVLPNIITAFGLACGLYVIFKVNMIGVGIGTYEMLFTSSVVVLIAALADVLDGAIARSVGGESEFGVMFDSLADAVSFGVAPSVLLLKSLSLEAGSWLSFLAFVVAMLYSICGILRLVRYNVKAAEAKKDELALAAYKKNFTGLPIPAAACCVISLNLFLNSPYCESVFSEQSVIKVIILCSAYFFIAGLMISKCKFMSLKALGFKVDAFIFIFLTVAAAIFILYGIIHHFPLVFITLFWGYLLLGCFLTIGRLIAGKKSQTLIDFDPDEDELQEK